MILQSEADAELHPPPPLGLLFGLIYLLLLARQALFILLSRIGVIRF